jgi:EAL domain-containing protein (putative c-di-GMP-specific phosphodiesterase class I)
MTTSLADMEATVPARQVLEEARATPDGFDQAFELMRQPIVDTRTDQVSHHELLLRLRAPDGRLMGPGEFAGPLRDMGLEEELDYWVVARAVLMLVPGDEVPHPQLEINLTQATMMNESFSGELTAALARRGVSPNALIVEVEAGGSVDPDDMAHLARLQFRLGHHFSAHDFRLHGFGQISRLRNLPYDFIKIDGEFIRDLPQSPEHQEVVKHLASLASHFNRKTVALHVEDAETMALLKEAGVDYGQGYFLGEPERLRGRSRT